MNQTIVAILTSAAVSSVVASLFSLAGQLAERRARRRQLIFEKALALAKDKTELLERYAKQTGKPVLIADFVVYAETYYWMLSHLQDKGKLPEDWQGRAGKSMDAVFGKDGLKTEG